MLTSTELEQRQSQLADLVIEEIEARMVAAKVANLAQCNWLSRPIVEAAWRLAGEAARRAVLPGVRQLLASLGAVRLDDLAAMVAGKAEGANDALPDQPAG